MALALFDRVQETTTTSGTGAVTLAGAVAGFQSFAVVGNGNTCYYTIVDGLAWEVGIGTYSTTGPTLARTTVLSNSDGNTSPITLSSNSKPVFLTYPAEKSVNLDASGNVSALGTVSSGTWQGSTVGVAYGGTGVTASSGANSVVLRDANQNILVNSVTQAVASTVSAAATTTLTVASPHFQILTGTTTQTFKLPDATLLDPGSSWVFDNDSTGNLTVTDNAGATVDVVAPGGYSTVFLEANGTVAGTWGKFGMIPSEVNWGTNNLDLGGSTTVTNGTWQGTPVAYNYGGTGLTTFTAANYALYSTSASALTAGTLPVAAGGTGQTSYTNGQLLIGNTTGNTLTKATLTQGTGITVTNGNGSITVANSLPMTYPGSGVAVSTGTAWGTSLVAASANTASALVQRDASGNFSAGTITATLSGTATQVSNSLTLATSGTGLSGSATFNGASAQTFTVTSNATNANTASTIVARDASGNFSAGTITAALSGNATTATTATNLAGGAAGNLHYQTGAGASAFVTNGTSGQVLTSAGASMPTWTTATNANTASAIVQRDASGNFSAGTITAALSGNASTATTATNQSGGTVSATTGSFSGAVTANAGISGTLRRGSYGSMSLNGSNNGYSGLDLYDQSSTWMTNIAGGVSFGVYKNNSAWAFYFNESGVLSVGTVPGGSVSGTVANATLAANASSISSAVGGSYTWTAANYFQSNLGGTSGSLSSPPLQVYCTGANSAFMSFHRGGNYAVNMGLDADNVLRIGGWSASANRLQMDMSGNLTMAGNVTAYSDETLKKDWADLRSDFLEQLVAVKHGTYTRIDSEERQMGVSAQDMQKFAPEVVSADNDGKLSLAYGNAALVACIELAKEVVALKAEIAELKKAR